MFSVRQLLFLHAFAFTYDKISRPRNPAQQLSKPLQPPWDRSAQRGLSFRPIIWVERSYTMIPGDLFFPFTVIPEHGHRYVRYALTNFRNPMTANLFLRLHIMAVRRGWKWKWNHGGLITGWTMSVRFRHLFT